MLSPLGVWVVSAPEVGPVCVESAVFSAESETVAVNEPVQLFDFPMR